MDPKVRRWAAFAISVAVLVGFIAVFWELLTTDWGAPEPGDGGRPEVDSTLAYYASLLAGAVGGIVASLFGQKLPPSKAPAGSVLSRRLSVAGERFAPISNAALRQVLALLYVVVYALVSGWAAFVSVRSENTPELVAGLGVVAAGVFVAVATSYMGDPENSQDDGGNDQ